MSSGGAFSSTFSSSRQSLSCLLVAVVISMQMQVPDDLLEEVTTPFLLGSCQARFLAKVSFVRVLPMRYMPIQPPQLPGSYLLYHFQLYTRRTWIYDLPWTYTPYHTSRGNVWRTVRHLATPHVSGLRVVLARPPCASRSHIIRRHPPPSSGPLKKERSVKTSDIRPQSMKLQGIKDLVGPGCKAGSRKSIRA